MSPPSANHWMLLPLLDSTSFAVLEVTDRLLPSTPQVLAGLHAYTLLPAGAVVRKKNCPTAQVDGRLLPVCIGLVDPAAEKSTLLLCVRQSTNVWPSPVAPNTAPRKRPAASLHLFMCLQRPLSRLEAVSARQDEATPDTSPAHHRAELTGQSPQVIESTALKSWRGV